MTQGGVEGCLVKAHLLALNTLALLRLVLLSLFRRLAFVRELDFLDLLVVVAQLFLPRPQRVDDDGEVLDDFLLLRHAVADLVEHHVELLNLGCHLTRLTCEHQDRAYGHDQGPTMMIPATTSVLRKFRGFMRAEDS